MHVDKLKYLISAQDMVRAVGFYQTVFDAEMVRQSEVMAELLIAGSTLGIHSGGEGKRTWTGLSFQVGDLFATCDLLRATGGTVLRHRRTRLANTRPASGFSQFFSPISASLPCWPAVELYQREVVTLSRASGVQVGTLREHHLVDLWREYCARLQTTFCSRRRQRPVSWSSISFTASILTS